MLQLQSNLDVSIALKALYLVAFCLCLMRIACSYPDYSVCSAFSVTAVAMSLADASALIQLRKYCFYQF